MVVHIGKKKDIKENFGQKSRIFFHTMQSQVQGAVAAWAQEGLEEIFHIQGQEGWL